MAISVVATANAVVSASRSPAATFTAITVAQNDVVLLFCNNGAATSNTITVPSGWVNAHPSGGNTIVASDSHTACAVYHLVTDLEAAANTLTYTATNLWDVAATGN